MDRGSVPSSMELRGSTGAEEEEEEDEEVLPLRAPRRVFVSVTWRETERGHFVNRVSRFHTVEAG